MRLRWTKAQSTVLSSTELKSGLGEKWDGKKRNLDDKMFGYVGEEGDYSAVYLSMMSLVAASRRSV